MTIGPEELPLAETLLLKEDDTIISNADEVEIPEEIKWYVFKIT